MHWTFALLPAFLLLNVACKQAEKVEKPLIAVSTSMLGDAASAIFGEHCEVYVLMGPGSNPHAYRPSPKDVFHLRKASVIWANGAHLEGKMQALWPSIQRQRPVLMAADFVPDSSLILHEGEIDPHFWFDPLLWMHLIQNLSNETGRLLFPGQSDWKTQQRQYLRQILQTHEEGQTLMQQIPENQRVLVSNHDAFSYFGRRYHFQLYALQGTSTLSEYGMYEILDLAHIIVKQNIPAIFIESNQNSYGQQSLQRSCKYLGHTVQIGPPLLTDALAPESPHYPAMLRHNFQAIHSIYQDVRNTPIQP